MPDEQTTVQEEAPVEEQEKYVIKDIFPIETARQNSNNYLRALHTRKFVNKIVSEISYSIRYHSERGESDAQIAFSILEVFGDYPIQKDDELFQEVLNISAKQFTDGGYTVFKEPISTDWGIKGFVVTISWKEDADETESERE
jgi:hypothetical protein